MEINHNGHLSEYHSLGPYKSWPEIPETSSNTSKLPFFIGIIILSNSNVSRIIGIITPNPPGRPEGFCGMGLDQRI